MLDNDLQAIGIDLDPNSAPSGNCRAEDLAPILYAVTELLPSTPDNQTFINDMKALRDRYESGTLTGAAADAWRTDVEGHLKIAWSDYQALEPGAQKAFSDRYQSVLDQGKKIYLKSPAEKLRSISDVSMARMGQTVLDALSPEEIAAYNEAAPSVQEKTGIRAALVRTYGQTEFYTWLVAEKGFSVDDVFDLPNKRSRQEIHDLFVEFEKDLNTVYSISPDSARILGERQSRFLDALADAHFPDVDARTPEEVEAAMDKTIFITQMLTDWIQDTPGLTGISGSVFDPARSAAFYQGAGGKDSYERRLQQMHGKVMGLSTLMTKALPGADEPVEMATRMSWFRDEWQKFRGKRFADVETAGFSTQEAIAQMVTSEAAERFAHPMDVTPEMEAEAEAFLAGGSGTLSWKGEADARYAKIKEAARQVTNRRVDVGAYRLSARPFDPQQFAGALPPAGTRVEEMPAEQRRDLFDKVSVGYQKVFGDALSAEMMEPLYSRGKDSFDAIRVNGRSVRELAEAELAGKDWAQPSKPGGPEPKEKLQYMQMMVLQKMADPESNVTMTLAQVDEKGQLKDMPPVELHAPARELKIGPTDRSHEGVDLAEAAGNFLFEGMQGQSITDEVRALADGFNVAKRIAIPKSEEDKLSSFGKDIYDTVFINGKSVNQVYDEIYHDRYDGSPVTKTVLKDALIMAHRMSPESKIELWHVDEQKDTFDLKKPGAGGGRDGVKGLSPAEKQKIQGLNDGLTRSLSQETRRAMADVPSLGPGVSLDKLKQIDEIWAQMESEKQGLHHNSREYREMKEAVREVHEAMVDFHPSDPNCQAEMRRLLGQVNTKAAEYMKDKVYEKTKKTARGVERKNMALALLDAAGGQIDESRVKDVRGKKSEVVKESKTLKDLIDEEHEAARSKHGEQAARSRRARRHEAAEKKHSQEKKASAKE